MRLSGKDLVYLTEKVVSVLLENSNDRKVNAWVKKFFNVDDFPTVRNIVMKTYEKIPYARTGNGKYLLGVLRILFEENLPRTQYPLLNELLKIIHENTHLQTSLDANLNGLDINNLKDFLGYGRDNFFNTQLKNIRVRKAANGYVIKKIDNYIQMRLSTDGEWCIGNAEDTWEEIIADGEEAVYLVENEEMVNRFAAYYKTHKQEHDESIWDLDDKTEDDEWEMPKFGSNQAPYDLYGLSRFVVVVSRHGFEVYSRYNLPNLADGAFLNKNELEHLLGLPFNEAFPFVCKDNVLTEIHKGQQLMLPFDGNSEPYNYMHFVEYLESIGKYGALSSTLNPKSVESWVKTDQHNFCKLAREVLDEEWGNDIENVIWKVCRFVEKEGLENVLSPTAYKQTKGELSSFESFLWDLYDNGKISNTEDLEQFFSNRCGVVKWREWLTNFADKVTEELLENFTTNERNLIYCERVITIPNAMGRANFYVGQNDYQVDTYEYLKYNFRGIGNCWSYINGGGEGYCASNYKGGETEILLKGWARPEDIDFIDTVRLTIYNEVELRLKYKALVEVDEAIIKNTGKRLPLKGSIVLPA